MGCEANALTVTGGARLLIINNMPAFYRTAPFAALIERFAEFTGGVGKVAYQVRRDPNGRGDWFFTSDADLPYEFYFSSAETKPSSSVTGYPLRIDWRLWSAYRPTHIFAAGWDSPLSVSAAAYSRARRTPMGVWVESNPSTSMRQGRFSNLFRRGFLRSASFSVVPTQASAAYVRALSGREMPIRQLLNPVSWNRLDDCTASSDRRMVFIGDLSRRKGFDVFRDVVSSGLAHGWTGVAWGRDIENLARDVPGNLQIHAARPLQSVLPHLRSSDVLVIPSRVDPAPLTYSEALALGLRVLVSDSIALAEHARVTTGADVMTVTNGASVHVAAARLLSGPRPGKEASELVTPEHWASEVLRGFFPHAETCT